MQFYAHSLKDRPEESWHLLKEHLLGVAEIAASYGYGDWARAAALLHDAGKYSFEFQQRLRGNPEKVDHSSAGAQAAVAHYANDIGTILAYCVAGHHTGLPDSGSKADDSALKARLGKTIPEYEAFWAEMQEALPKINTQLPLKPLESAPYFSLSMFIRMVFSSLVDADFLDTESFFVIRKTEIRRQKGNIFDCRIKLEHYLKELQNNSFQNDLSIHRQKISERCKLFAEEKPGLYSLTVPTGGGKTLASFRFAINHLHKHKMDRIIYVIPYTSIIEQNAEVLRKVVGSDVVLEHHSNLSRNDLETESWPNLGLKLKLAEENWDIPVVVTTNVQFFESIFSHRPGSARKVHNIANSVIILDEAQAIPIDVLKPCYYSLIDLVRNHNCTAVLCTATQPAFEGVFGEYIPPIEIIENPAKLYRDLRRVKAEMIGKLDDENVVAQLSSHNQVLCIVNTRKHAAKLFSLLKGQEGYYHLSASMCAVHRKSVINQIRNDLEEGRTCKVISTQLIEAGVDVDFPIVFRAMAGIDSIVQSAGRCNRNGKEKTGTVNVFHPEKVGMPGGYLGRTAQLAYEISRQYSDILSLEAIKAYFQLLYGVEKDRLDANNVMECLSSSEFSFHTAAMRFKMIEDSDRAAIIIPYDDLCRRVLKEMKEENIYSSSRMLQPYTVQIQKSMFSRLVDASKLDILFERFFLLNDMSFYDNMMGLKAPANQTN